MADPSTARPTRRVLVIVFGLVLLGTGCGDADDGATSATSSPGATGLAVPTTFGLPTTGAPATTAVPATTTTAATATTTTTTVLATSTTAGTTTAGTTTSTTNTVDSSDAASPTTAVPPCPVAAALPTEIRPDQQITGNVDGDELPDVVTTYVGADGAPHVMLQPGSGAASDVVVQLGEGIAPSEAVAISFEDFDHSLGAITAPPLVVLAIGSAADGSARATFLSPVETSAGGHCLTQWVLDGEPFSFPIVHNAPPYAGLLCEGAAGRVYYVLRQATPASTTPGTGTGTTMGGATSTTSIRPLFTVTSQQIEHDGATVTLTELGTETIPDDGTIDDKFGDIVGCGHPPLF